MGGECIIKAYGSEGLCYRIGGDEFCVILKKGSLTVNLDESMDENDAVSVQKITGMNLKFEEILKEARKTEPLLPDVSLGYKIFDGKDEIEEAVKKADEYMYEIKKNKKQSC